MSIQQYYLGCPIWGNKSWVGELFADDAKPPDFLRQYAAVFNTVEGNTTFYGLPTATTVARWRDDTPPDFRFCFKFPRSISHDKRLGDVQAETEHFLNTLAPLGERLGPLFLQLPPTFGASELPRLDQFLSRLSDQFSYAVEVRHPDFFAGGAMEEDLDGLLASLGIDRVIFDARGLHAADPRDPATREAQRKKPNLPVRAVTTGQRPFVRFVAHPDVPSNDALLEAWATVVAEWLAEGRTPFVFLHAPDDFFAPRLARRFHQLLADRVPVGTMPPWPADADAQGPPPAQLSLF